MELFSGMDSFAPSCRRFVGSSLHGRREGVLHFLIYDECLLKRHQPDVIFWPQRLRISGPGGKLILGLLIG